MVGIIPRTSIRIDESVEKQARRRPLCSSAAAPGELVRVAKGANRPNPIPPVAATPYSPPSWTGGMPAGCWLLPGRVGGVWQLSFGRGCAAAIWLVSARGRGTSSPRGHARSGYCPARRGRLVSRPRNTCTALLLPGLPPWFRPRTSSTARKHDGKVDPVELIRDDHLIEHRSGGAGRGHHGSVLDESRLRVSQ